MSDDRFKNKYRIETARAWWHDYNGGAYFVTICTKNREHYFGEIENGQMLLSEIGEFVSKCIEKIPQHNPYATIPKYTIMPNHLHLIVVISLCRDAPRHVSDNNDESNRDVPWRVSTKDEIRQDIANRQTKLSISIGGFKQSVTRFANENDIEFAWQTRFHDHIIRETDELNRIATYIENNVANWVDDEFYSPKKTSEG